MTDKFIVALPKGIEPGRAANVTAHLCLGIVAAASDRGGDWLSRMSFADFPDADGNKHEPISTLGAIILAGRPAWLRRLREEAAARSVIAVDFTDAMTVGTGEQQQETIARTIGSDLNYLGVGLFGSVDDLDPLTGHFSLYK
ncbi:DUF2000 domain-containing protein [Arthrobacter castelli]|uniref:DUF2000 domain-containing protein n=1 Tax=Arthrobacter castelli TaxID=271431 RepID=UPI00041757FB|nr:DUF2000 domain-containing protein [Arthrobacter castelli]